MHAEDMDLGSVSFLHWGKAKVWYVVASASVEELEEKIGAMVKQAAPEFCEQYTDCANVMRHKEFVITPQFLRENKIKHSIIFQHPGEFVLTFPRGYHEGWNLGLNLAEATNFGNKDWIPNGLGAKQCTCDRPQKTGANVLVFPMEPFSEEIAAFNESRDDNLDNSETEAPKTVLGGSRAIPRFLKINPLSLEEAAALIDLSFKSQEQFKNQHDQIIDNPQKFELYVFDTHESGLAWKKVLKDNGCWKHGTERTIKTMPTITRCHSIARKRPTSPHIIQETHTRIWHHDVEKKILIVHYM